MTKRTARKARAPRGAPTRDTLAGSELPLPHEHDESPQVESDQTGDRGKVRRAARDVAAGLRDTEARGTPSNVPPGPKRSGD